MRCGDGTIVVACTFHASQFFVARAVRSALVLSVDAAKCTGLDRGVETCNTGLRVVAGILTERSIAGALRASREKSGRKKKGEVKM